MTGFTALGVTMVCGCCEAEFVVAPFSVGSDLYCALCEQGVGNGCECEAERNFQAAHQPGNSDLPACDGRCYPICDEHLL